jgi:hypothetical protein
MFVILTIAIVHTLINKLTPNAKPLSHKGEQETKDIENCINTNASKQQFGESTPEEEALLSEP